MNVFTPEVIAELTAPLDRANVSTRKGSGGMKLSYLEGWFVTKEANRIFGHDGWSSEVLNFDMTVTPTGEPNGDRNGRPAFTAVATATVRVNAGGVVHDGVGVGQGIDYSGPAAAIEGAAKEAETDALKRALIKFGNPFGLALYDREQSEVVGKAKSKSLLGG